MKLFLVLILLLSLFNDQVTADDGVFVATNQWQVVKKGQKIPKGLHVRINFETGITEAKLLDPEESTPSEDKTTALLPVTVKIDPDEETAAKAFDKSTLEDALKNIKGDDILNPDEIKRIKDEFRSYDDIKKSLGELNLTPKIDAEIIADLLAKHKELEEDNEILIVLEDLDFLAHQYDNAIEFVRQNGFHDIIYKNLNSTSVAVKKETLKLMGSLMQNNNKPKIHALETGAVSVLLRVINFDVDSGVKIRALTALSSLLRSFPAAQKSFVANGGLNVVSKYFDSNDIKIQTKIVTMISDLITEYNWAVEDNNLSLYYQFDLSKNILEHNWCENLNTLLYTLMLTDQNDHDSLEKCLTAMQTIKGKCRGKFKKTLVENLKRHYETLIVNDSDREDLGNAGFFQSLRQICDEILQDVNIKTEL